MSNLRLKDHTWDAANVYDSALGKTQEQINAGKQETLVSGENIKTVNGASILGSGNIEIQGGGGSSVVVDDTLSIAGDAADAKKTGDEITDLKSAINTLSEFPGINEVALTDFTVVEGTTYTVDSATNSITITNTGTGNYASVQSDLSWCELHLIPGKTYRLHAKAEKVSGSPNMVIGIRGKDGHEYDMAAYVELNSTGEGYIDFVANKYMRYVSLFVSFGNKTQGSVAKFSDIWIKEYNATEKPINNAYENAIIYPNTILDKAGKVTNNNLWWSTGLIPVDKTAIAYFSNTKFVITEHTERKTPSFFNREVIRQDGSLFQFDSRTNYFRLSFLNTMPFGEAAFVPVYDAQDLSITDSISRLSNPPLTWGRENVLSRARHFLDIEWTPVAPIPIVTGSHKYRIASAGETMTGLPYSSTRNVCKLVGVNISIYTFMTALKNPRSVLYTRKIITGYVGATYYGQHCASFVAYALGDKGCAIDSLSMAQWYCDEISKYELQPGDMLISAKDRTLDFNFMQHCLLVYDVYRDQYGRIETLQIAEGNMPYVRYNDWVYFDEVERLIGRGYKCYRGKAINATPYTASEFVKGYPDETLPTFVYPDIMPEYGDKACVEAGTDVVINVVDAKTYTQIKVYKDGTLIDTRSAISDFTMTDIAYGKYRFVITDGNNTSESSLIAVAVSGTYDSNTGVVTFSCSNNAKPVAMQSYADESSKPGYGGVHNLEHLFTAEEIRNGQANASAITSNYFPHVQVSFMTEYGTAVWSSQPLSDQWAPWNPNDLQILTQPLDTNTKLGTEFTMSVLVNKDNVNYQWQYYYQNSWNDFVGSNAASLTKHPANLAWNGWKIRCIVTDANDPTVTVTSRKATLRVSS